MSGLVIFVCKGWVMLGCCEQDWGDGYFWSGIKKATRSGFCVKCIRSLASSYEFGPSTRSMFTFALPALVIPSCFAAP